MAAFPFFRMAVNPLLPPFCHSGLFLSPCAWLICILLTYPCPHAPPLTYPVDCVLSTILCCPSCSPCNLPPSPGTPDCGPVYSHLGSGRTLQDIRQAIQASTGYIGHQIRLEKVVYTGREGKTDAGCPMAKWVSHRLKTSCFIIEMSEIVYQHLV